MMALGYHQSMPVMDRGQIEKSQNIVIFIDFGTGDLTLGNAAENAISISHETEPPAPFYPSE
jgi:hypothetical protein